VIGKAGGATVHEAMAARCPMLIHHLVPGQEEGNIELLEKHEVGLFTSTPEEISEALGKILADDAALWRKQKDILLDHSRPGGALNAADFVMDLLDPAEDRVWGCNDL